jgi:tetratricopeptide (TPR) repeat protein
VGGPPAGDGEVLERAAEGLYFDGDYAAAAARYEQAYAAYRRAGRLADAGRAARTLGWISGGVLGEWAVESGWLARARSLLAEAGPHGPEEGWLLILTSFGEGDLAAREGLLRAAVESGRRHRDPDVEFDALGYLGGLLILTGRVEQGLVHFDEAMAAACAGEMVDVAAVDALVCGFFWACELLTDVARADQWMRGPRRPDGAQRGGRGVLPGPLRRDPHRRRPVERGRDRAARRDPPVRPGRLRAP